MRRSTREVRKPEILTYGEKKDAREEEEEHHENEEEEDEEILEDFEEMRKKSKTNTRSNKSKGGKGAGKGGNKAVQPEDEDEEEGVKEKGKAGGNSLLGKFHFSILSFLCPPFHHAHCFNSLSSSLYRSSLFDKII